MPSSASCPIPGEDCPLCPRLVEFRAKNRAKYPDKWNAPVPSFGPENCQLLIVGLAPGLQGANFTGRPFTGDWAGDLLYSTLLKFGYAEGVYDERPDDGLTLKNCRITNAIRCVPPENKPTPLEEKTCRSFLVEELKYLKNVKVILSLGLVSHNAVLKTFDQKISAHKFAHGAVHDLGTVKLIDSYHCSRYNTNTGRLTTEMFEDIFRQINGLLQPIAGSASRASA
jgi:uracil-DNA glycosylase family 4